MVICINGDVVREIHFNTQSTVHFPARKRVSRVSESFQLEKCENLGRGYKRIQYLVCKRYASVIGASKREYSWSETNTCCKNTRRDFSKE